MFNIGPLMINMYGIMFASGFLAASLLASRITKKSGMDTEITQNLILVIFGGVIVGARLFYVAFYWPEGKSLGFVDVFKVWEGGLAFYGGFLGALLSGYLFVKKKGLNFWKYADILTLPLILGHIFGRVGDYLTGGHPGKETTLTWGIYLDNAVRHPVVLYEIIGLILIGASLVSYKRGSRIGGFLFLTYVQLYAVQRLFLDIFRIESTDPRTIGLTPTQILVIALFAMAVIAKRRIKNGFASTNSRRIAVDDG
ncbi:MAG: prolipoprotein diacylglyceryl transferase [Spirochaetaceae bacterium]|nr:prolipoprotein diacylglyceryl transferase [Spirochaetaceae bacterium]